MHKNTGNTLASGPPNRARTNNQTVAQVAGVGTGRTNNTNQTRTLANLAAINEDTEMVTGLEPQGVQNVVNNNNPAQVDTVLEPQGN